MDLQITNPTLSFGASTTMPQNSQQLSSTDQKTVQVSHQIENAQTQNSEWSLNRIIEPVIIWSSSLSATGVTVTSAVALAYFVKDSCDTSIAPFIASVVTATVTTVLAVGREYYDYRKEKNRVKEAFIEKTTRDQLEKERHEELSKLLLKTLASVQNYQVQKNTNNFKECLNAIKDLPKDSKEYPKIRELWLSTIIQMSNDEGDLKSTLSQLEKLGAELKSNASTTSHIPIKKNSQANVSPGEAKGVLYDGQKESDLAKKVEKFQNLWSHIEATVGFDIDFLEIDKHCLKKNIIEGDHSESSIEEETRLQIN